MRIVEYQSDTTSVSIRTIKALGVGSAVFSIVLLALMLGNYVSLKRNDPIHSPALLRLTEDLKSKQQDESLKTQIQELDYLARRAFFSGQRFTQIATLLLLGSVAVTIISFKTLSANNAKFPYPGPNPPKDDLAANAQWARNAVTAAGLVLVGLALSLALPWSSSLNEVEKAAVVPTKKDVVAAAPGKKIETPDVVSYVGKEERLKNWPGLFGAAGGHANSTNLPIAWDGESGQGIAWKTPIAKPGFGSPIIWNNRIFLSGADETGREVYCFNAEDGALAWKHEVRDVPGSLAELPKVATDTGFAASTMATDGTRVFAIFATGDVVGLDFEGRRLWARNLGVPENHYGHGSSLAIFNDVLLIQYDQEKGGALYGLDAKSGETRWKTPRELGLSWASPILIERDGKSEVILSASPAVVSYDPKSGQELWRVEYSQRGEVAPTPAFGGGLIFVSADNGSLIAVDPAKREVAWKDEDSVPGVCTPTIAGEYLIYGLNDGGIVCRDAKSGKEIWQHETDNGFYASPVLAGDRVYLMERRGQMHIFSATNQFNLLGSPKLGEEAVATPAVKGNSIIYRGTKNLFRIGS